MKNELLKKIKVFLKGLFPNIGKEVKPVVIERVVPGPKATNGPVKKGEVVKKTKTEISVKRKVKK